MELFVRVTPLLIYIYLIQYILFLYLKLVLWHWNIVWRKMQDMCLCYSWKVVTKLWNKPKLPMNECVQSYQLGYWSFITILSHVGSCLTENYWQKLQGRCKSVKSLSLKVLESNKEFQMVEVIDWNPEGRGVNDFWLWMTSIQFWCGKPSMATWYGYFLESFIWASVT